MEYYKDLLENDFSRKHGYKYAWIFNVVFGFLMLFLSVYYLKVFSHEIEELHIIVSTLFFTNGLIFTLRGFNFKIEKLFGKAFIKINDRGFILKTSPFKSEQSIYWQDIESVHYTAGKFTFLKNDGSKIKFSVIELNYATIQEIKEAVSKYTQLNDITLE